MVRIFPAPCALCLTPALCQVVSASVDDVFQCRPKELYLSFSFFQWFCETTINPRVGGEILSRKDVLEFFLDLLVRRLSLSSKSPENTSYGRLRHEHAVKFIGDMAPLLYASPKDPEGEEPSSQSSGDDTGSSQLHNAAPRKETLWLCLSAAVDTLLASHNSNLSPRNKDVLQAFFKKLFVNDDSVSRETAEVTSTESLPRCNVRPIMVAFLRVDHHLRPLMDFWCWDQN